MSSIVSEFYGMQIMMPRFKGNSPYFEVYYDGMTHQFSIFPCRMLTREKLSPTAQETIKEWATIHKRELEENWECLQTEKPFKKIKPIE